MKTQDYELRKALVHLIRSGKSVQQAARELGRSRAWAEKWWRRFRQNQNWADLQDQPRTPKNQPSKLPTSGQQSIRQARSELEADAHDQDSLGYIGAHAIRAHLQKEQIEVLPSIGSIERELRACENIPHYVRNPGKVPTGGV